MPLKADLSFTLPDSGVTLLLKPIEPVLLQRFIIEWGKKYPKPVPPLIEINIAGKLISQPDAKDAYFIMQLEDWSARQNTDVLDFMLAYGVLDRPPDDWLPDEIFYSGHLPEYQRKALWISGQIRTVKDLTALQEAIEGLNSVTEGGLEASKNGTPPLQAEPPSSNGQSNNVPTAYGLIIP